MLRQSLREAFIANPKVRVTAEHVNYWIGKGYWERERLCRALVLISSPALPAQILLVNQVMFALFLLGSMQNAVLLQMEEGKEEKGMQEASGGRECFRNGSLTLPGFPAGCLQVWHVSVPCHTCWHAWSHIPGRVPKDSEGEPVCLCSSWRRWRSLRLTAPFPSTHPQPVSAESPWEGEADVPEGE